MNMSSITRHTGVIWVLMLGLIFRSSNGAWNVKRVAKVNIAPVLNDGESIDVITVNASFGVNYTSYINKTWVTVFYFAANFNKSSAVEVTISSFYATKAFPVLFVVREQRRVLSFEVPLVLKYLYRYHSITRTLCPDENNSSFELQPQEFFMEVSTMSRESNPVSLQANVKNLDIQAGHWHNVTVGPSSPKYFRYRFTANVDSVLVKAESSDSVCMVLSIQDVECPIYDLDRDVKFIGSHQTMTHKAAMTVEKAWFTQGEFFIILVPKPSDYDCAHIEDVTPYDPSSPDINRSPNDKKLVSILIQPSLTAQEFEIATILVVGFFGMYYVVTFVILCIHQCRSHDFGVSRSAANGEMQYPNASILERSPLINGEPSESVPTDVSSGAQLNYGAIGSTQQDTLQEGPLEQNTNHRRAPGTGQTLPLPEDYDSSDPSADDLDMLPELDHDKDLYRTKPYLYVMDLARKPRRSLNRKFKLYFWNIVTIAIFYGLPVVQLVITYQTVLNTTGDEDICYYNFYCAHRLGVLSAFNNVFSNIGYVMLGMLFLILVYRRDTLHKHLLHMHDRYEKYYGIPQHFGLFYAMGLALVMEGVLSGCYHVCPNYSNFQFDTSFMYMMAWLCMLKIYQSRHPDVNPHAHTAYFGIAFIITIAVLGVFSGTTWYYYVFAIIQIVACVFLSIQVYYMGRWNLDLGIFARTYHMIRTDRLHFLRPIYVDRMILLVIGNLVNYSFAMYGMITQPKDFPSYLVAIFMVNLLMYFAFYIIMKLRSGERLLLQPLCYIIICAVLWGFAAYFFLSKLTSWEYTPAKSREGNQDCILFGFYDAHDVWHFLSAMSMFFGFMILLTLDDDLIHVPRDKIPVF